jgi:transcriptional regulator with XRE-family HTH domain
MVRESPAVARRRLRLALRELREERGMTQGEVAKRLEWSLSKVNRIELGEIRISSTDLQAVLRLFEVTDEVVADTLAQHCRIARQRSWWDDARYRTNVTPAMIDLLQFGSDAVTVHSFHAMIMPGLAQTAAYTRSTLDALADDLSAEQREARLEFRIRMREQVLDRPDPPRYVLIIDESVVSREVGGPETMVEQLQYLLTMSREGNTEVRVLPLSPPVLLSIEAPFALVDLEGDDSIVYRESAVYDELLDSREAVDRYRRIVNQMLDKALSVGVSRRLIEAKVAALLSALDRA